MYYLIEAKYFDSLYSLITHYRTSPLITPGFSVVLREPVPQPNLHESKEWYHKNTGKNQAEEILRRIKSEGAFLVRPSENDSNCYTISFRYVFLVQLRDNYVKFKFEIFGNIIWLR